MKSSFSKSITTVLVISFSLLCCEKDSPKKIINAAISTTSITNISSTSALSGGTITTDGGASVKERGVVWSTNVQPTIALTTKTTNGTGTGSFTSSITNLQANTKYYVRAYAANSNGTAYGNEVVFTTVTLSLPIISTSPVSSITTNAATSGGNITNDGGASVTARGVVWSTNVQPTIALTTKTTNGTGTGSFTSSITNLQANTKYYVRAYATNSNGTAYGNEVLSTTASDPNSFTDPRDGKIYPIKTIGNQVWMVKNMDYFDPLGCSTIDGDCQSWCYDNNNSNCAKYGRLYNIWAARRACPAGWHLPDTQEWLTFVQGLGDIAFAGGKMKSTTGWDSPNSAATNQSAFNALPGGWYDINISKFTGIGKSAVFWMYNYAQIGSSFTQNLWHNSGTTSQLPIKSKSGASCRCVKDK